MGDEVIALEDKTNTVIAIRIPIGIAIVLSGDTINNNGAFIGPIKTTQNVKKGGFAGS